MGPTIACPETLSTASPFPKGQKEQGWPGVLIHGSRPSTDGSATYCLWRIPQGLQYLELRQPMTQPRLT